MCMLCLFILLIPWEGRWQSVSCSLDTYAAAIALLNVQYAGNVKFSKQNKHRQFVNWRIFCSSFWISVLFPCSGCKRAIKLPCEKPSLTQLQCSQRHLFLPGSDTEPCPGAACLSGSGGAEVLTWTPSCRITASPIWLCSLALGPLPTSMAKCLSVSYQKSGQSGSQWNTFWFCAPACGAEERKHMWKLLMQSSLEPSAWQLIPSLIVQHSQIGTSILDMGTLLPSCHWDLTSGACRKPWAYACSLPIGITVHAQEVRGVCCSSLC